MQSDHKPDASDLGRDDFSATYCPEDNKLRLYTDRVERETFLWLRANGYTATPKQDCSFVATWSPAREDVALSMIEDGDDIGDEDQSPEDRAADRAERFGGYRDKRRGEARELADRYDAGPPAYGSQDAARAERAAAKRDRIGGKACSQWSKAEYWQARTAGVISNALHKSSARVRRGRVLRLEADARRLKMSPRWAEHYENRLSYERAMLENEGGSAAAVDMIPGGFIGSYQIHKVNKSPVTKAVVSVGLWSPHQWRKNPDGSPVMGIHPFNIQRMGEDAYRSPTAEELKAFKAATAERKAKAKAAKPKTPPLINPTDADAQRLQDVWNAGADKPAEVVRMTQAQYSARSGGSYGPVDTVWIGADGKPTHEQYRGNVQAGAAFKVRRFKMSEWGGAYRVIVITDKPAKPLPAADFAEAVEA